MLTPELKEKITAIISEANPEVYIVEMRLKKSKRSVLAIRIDTDKGIILDECTRISRAVGNWMEEADVFDFEYSLEVSSPGVGEPLLLPRQYKKEIGRSLRVILKALSVVEGKLLDATETHIQLALSTGKKLKKGEEPKVMEIAIEDIKEAKVIIVF